MELDDLKAAWNKDAKLTLTRESLQQRITRIEKSGRKIRRAFVLELVVIGAIYLFFVGSIVIFQGEIQSFIYKLVAITSIGFLPAVYRLYRSQQWINAMDYANDIRSNLVAFLAYYKTTLKWCWWSSMIISMLMFIILFTDKDFLVMDIEWKIGTCVYILLVMVITRPYIKKVYARHIQEIEIFLE
jgi:hypothetical protein